MTTALFREDSYSQSCKAVVTASTEQGFCVDQTVFYPLGGGQPGDSGMGSWDGKKSRIADIRNSPEACGLHLTSAQLNRRLSWLPIVSDALEQPVPADLTRTRRQVSIESVPDQQYASHSQHEREPDYVVRCPPPSLAEPASTRPRGGEGEYRCNPGFNTDTL
jgi:Ser-tRNA(Ala) deacylase AlaX